MTLTLPAHLRDAIIKHCQAEHPLEACGIVAGRDDLPQRHIPMVNVEQSHNTFRVDMETLLDVYDAIDDAGEDAVVIYHSHTASEAVPSRTDHAASDDETIHYLIVDTRTDTMRSYRSRAGRLVEERIGHV